MEEFRNEEVITLGLRKEADYICDLSIEAPSFINEKFESIFHVAGSEDEATAMELNFNGTKNLLASLEKNPPDEFVYISSFRVYSRDAGEMVNEDANTWASGEVGRSKALAEEEVKNWCRQRNVTLTIIRPARMFGNGVKGETLRLFNDAISGKYIHIRGNDARISLVTAYDVARAIKAVYKRGGIYNACDGKTPRYIDMIEAMTANAGAKKRMTHLPSPWAEWIWRLGRWIPLVERNLSPSVVEERMKTLTLDGSRLAKESGISFHDTINVIEHTDKTYPYSDGGSKIRKSVHEV